VGEPFRRPEARLSAYKLPSEALGGKLTPPQWCKEPGGGETGPTVSSACDSLAREGVCLLAAALHDACYFVVIEPFQGGGRASKNLLHTCSKGEWLKRM
jgi:hypothetical protein